MPQGVDEKVVRSMLPDGAADELVAFYASLLDGPDEPIVLHPSLLVRPMSTAIEDFVSRRAWFDEHDEAITVWRMGSEAFREYFVDTPLGPNHWALETWPEWYAVLPEDPAVPCKVEYFPEGGDTVHAFDSLSVMVDMCSLVFEDDTERRLVPDPGRNGLVTVTGGEWERFGHIGAPRGFFPW